MVDLVVLEESPPISERHIRRWRIPAGGANKQQVINEIIGLLRRRAPMTPATLFRCRLCLDEALTNSLTHGCPEGEGQHIDVDFHWTAPVWVVRIRDEGPGFDAEEVLDPTGPGAELVESGRGILILERYCDELIYSRGGREVTFRMRMEGQAG